MMGQTRILFQDIEEPTRLTRDIKGDLDVPKGTGGFCPSIIRKKVGLFNEETSNSTVKNEFPDTVLLVASNYAYYNMLQNWEWLANRLGLKWVVLALDEKLYEELGPERAVAPDQDFSVSGEQKFRKGQFHTLTCNKMKMALEISNNCNVNVVFTDADNIFFKNPFEHDLGKMIRSNRYDYLYQSNNIAAKPREHKCIKGTPDRENNTGFYYIRHGNEVYKRITESTLAKCADPKNKIDDQSLFWNQFWEMKHELKNSSNFHHCGYEDALSQPASREEINLSFNWCCMDPYYYPIGKTGKKSGKKRRRKDVVGPTNRDPVTYHANFVAGYGSKVQKLRDIRKDGFGWNETRFMDGVGGLLATE